MIPALQRTDGGADLDDSSRPFMTEHRWERKWPSTVPEGDVGATDARADKLHHDLVRSRIFELDGLDRQRSTPRAKHRRGRLHQNPWSCGEQSRTSAKSSSANPSFP